MKIAYTTLTKPASRELLNAVVEFTAPLTDAFNTFDLAGPAPKWVQGFSREFFGLTLCIYGPDEVEEGTQVYVRFQEHTAPNGRVVQRVVIIPTATAKRQPFNPIATDAQTISDLMASWAAAGESAFVVMGGNGCYVEDSDGHEVNESWSPEEEHNSRGGRAEGGPRPTSLQVVEDYVFQPSEEDAFARGETFAPAPPLPAPIINARAGE
jgi:hypothetical protein